MTDKAGDTARLYGLFRQRKGGLRPLSLIEEEGRAILRKLQARGLDLGWGHDGQFRAPLHIQQRLEANYLFATRIIYEWLTDEFLRRHQTDLVLSTLATGRKDYVLHPVQGEQLDADSVEKLLRHRQKWINSLAQQPTIENERIPLQIVISDGLNHCAIEENDHVDGPNGYLTQIRDKLKAIPLFAVMDRDIVVVNGRVRAGYQVGKLLFGKEERVDREISDVHSNSNDNTLVEEEDMINVQLRAGVVLHVIGERPGNGQNTFSIYISAVSVEQWREGIDHNVVSLVSGVSKSAVAPSEAAKDTVDFLLQNVNHILKL